MRHNNHNPLIRCLLAAVIVLVAILPAAAAPKARPATLSADTVFINLPIEVVEILNRSTRMDMLDYYRVDSIYSAPNLVGGVSKLEMVTPDYLKVHLTDVSTLEVKVLPLGKSGDIAAVSYTVDSTGDQPDSELFFFDSQMRLLDRDKIAKAPKIKEFFKIDKGSLTSEKELVEMVKFPTILYSFSPDSTTLTAKLTVGKYLDPDDYNIMKLFLLPELQYRWTGKKYDLQKR